MHVLYTVLSNDLNIWLRCNNLMLGKWDDNHYLRSQPLTRPKGPSRDFPPTVFDTQNSYQTVTVTATYVMQHLHKMELDTSNPNSGVSLAFYFSKRSSTITMCWSGPNQISFIYLFTYCQSRTMLISNGSFPEQGCGCSTWTREVSFLRHLTFCQIGSILLICVDVLKTGSSLKR